MGLVPGGMEVVFAHWFFLYTLPMTHAFTWLADSDAFEQIDPWMGYTVLGVLFVFGVVTAWSGVVLLRRGRASWWLRLPAAIIMAPSWALGTLAAVGLFRAGMTPSDEPAPRRWQTALGALAIQAASASWAGLAGLFSPTDERNVATSLSIMLVGAAIVCLLTYAAVGQILTRLAERQALAARFAPRAPSVATPPAHPP